jgi:DNA-binding response OmpR family regulator
MRKKLLVVDDERDICDFVKNFFSERNFDVFVALSGDEALGIARAEKPEIVLLDVKMKGMDGVAILKHLKDMDRNLKVIMVTALEDQETMYEAYRLGAADYITKPLVLDYLVQSIEKNLKIV